MRRNGGGSGSTTWSPEGWTRSDATWTEPRGCGTTRSRRSSATQRRDQMIIHKTVTVARPPDVTFKIFVEEIGKWWPNEKYMFLGSESQATIETRVGGRVYNRHPDGREYTIGEVLRYEPG